ncbi:unnamed protein product [Zymoseptoria tritici ST99CH_1E4]|uniref:Uncharacterized protein n=2 Tax=Zymoseptoria tritici TaxID=1047171 RepID=F9XGH7_ZYMTI|nr:uncharacterized protein MYCGRDRAFT_100649 [Zymoseptoria tritici IPO323]EGP86265.1 hypothetical protein MYCGRDRAFT_100649 [Zymoseptoria tritici IPO323]SMR55014.1 unnamed protein product [Zymoseptoria tritici ST99CH_1E4]
MNIFQLSVLLSMAAAAALPDGDEPPYCPASCYAGAGDQPLRCTAFDCNVYVCAGLTCGYDGTYCNPRPDGSADCA